MKAFSAALRGCTITYSRGEVLAVAMIAATVGGWASVAAGSFSALALLACEAAFFAFYLAGSLIAGLKPLAEGVLFDLPLRLLVGYAVINSALFALAWLSPLGIVPNFAILLALVMAAFFGAGERTKVRVKSVSAWAVGLCVVATTLWCQDSIRPTAAQGDTVVFKPWIDGFYHAVHIRIFGASHGASTIEDFRLAGVPARPYHYGVYLLPAFVKQLAGLHSYAAFAGVLSPVGTLFTGLAAYAFFGSLWGAWPGLAAAAALLLLPDGAQQGMDNPFMSYHWLTQISPSATYGLALLAVAWVFVIQGSLRGSRAQLLFGWAMAAVLAIYKLHFVIASGLLLLLVPALFFPGAAGAARRAALSVAALAAYVFALFIGQRVPGVPLIRFDGSSLGEILRLIQSFAEPGELRDVVVAHMGAKATWIANLLFGIPYVLLAALGTFAPVLALLVVRLWRSTPRLYLLFPLLLVANFLAMFFGLALDFSSSTPDELSHRPVMIVYFFVAGWVGGALGSMLVRSGALAAVAPRWILVVSALLLLVPATLGAGVQRMWAMPLISPVRVPLPLLRVAEYVREHGPRDDVFQDSQFDRTYALAALAERRTFVAHTLTSIALRADIAEVRTNAIDRFMGIRHKRGVAPTARALGIRWFVLHPGDRVDWPAEDANAPVLASGPLKLYRF